MKMLPLLLLLFQGAMCVFIPGKANVAQHKPAEQSSFFHEDEPRFKGKLTADFAVDGNIYGIIGEYFEYNSCSHTRQGLGWHWWMVDLEEIYSVHSIRITNRWDCCDERFKNFTIEVSKEDPKTLNGFPNVTTAAVCTTHSGILPSPFPVPLQCDEPVSGRYVRVVMMADKKEQALIICEFEVFSKPNQHLVTTPIAPELKGPNLAFYKPTKQAGNSGMYRPDPERAVDKYVLGNFMKGHCAEVNVDIGWQWWMVDLKDVYIIGSLRLTTRFDAFHDRFSNFSVEVSKEDPATLPGFPGKTNAAVCMTLLDSVPPLFHVPYACDQPVTGRYIRVIRYAPGNKNFLTICDFQVFEKVTPATSPTKARTTTASEVQTSTPNGPAEKPSGVELWNKWQQWLKKLQKDRHSLADDCPTVQ